MHARRIVLPVLMLLGLAVLVTPVSAGPARPLPPEQVLEIPRTASTIRQDIDRTEKLIRKDRKELEKMARQWSKSGEEDPEGALTLKMQGIRNHMDQMESRLRGLHLELAEAKKDGSTPEIAAARLEVARQGTRLEAARNALLRARTEAELDSAQAELQGALRAYDAARGLYLALRKP